MIALEDVVRRLIDDEKFVKEIPNKLHRELLGYMFGLNNGGRRMTRADATRRMGKYPQYGTSAISILCDRFSNKIGEKVYYEDENTAKLYPVEKPVEGEEHRMSALSTHLVNACYRDLEDLKARIMPYVEEVFEHRLNLELQRLAIDAVERIQTMDGKRGITLTIQFKKPVAKD